MRISILYLVIESFCIITIQSQLTHIGVQFSCDGFTAKRNLSTCALVLNDMGGESG